MKNRMLKSVLAVLCLLPFHTSALAQESSSRFNGGYFGTSPAGPISRVEATISGNYLYGSVFLRGIDTYDFLYFYGRNVDRAGNVRGTFYSSNYSGRPTFFGRDGGTFSGKVTGGVLVLTFKTSQGSAKVVLLKAMGYAPTFIAGRVVSFNDGRGRVNFYFDEKKVFTRGDDYVPYTYRKTGPNTGTVSISGVGTAQLTFTNRWSGSIVGQGLNTTFDSYDYSDD